MKNTLKILLTAMMFVQFSLKAQTTDISLFGNWEALIGPGSGNGVSNPIQAMVVVGNDIYIGGSFTQVNVGGSVVNANYIARYNTLTNTWSTLGSGGGNGVNSVVSALATDGTFLYVGGSFTQANVGGSTVAVSNLARFNLSTNAWQNVGSGVNGSVYSLAISGTNLFVGGGFNLAGGSVLTQGIARLNLNNSTWNSLGSRSTLALGASVHTLVVEGDTLFVGGLFSTDNGSQLNAVARVNWQTNQWSKLGTGFGNGLGYVGPFTVPPWVQAIVVSGDTIYVGGRFNRANQGGVTVTANHLALFRRSTNEWHPILSGSSNGVENIVNTLLLNGQQLIVGGDFLNAGNISANCIAVLNTSSHAWNPLGSGLGNGIGGVVGIPSPTNYPSVRALVRLGNDIYVAGYFLRANESGVVVDANHVARYGSSVPSATNSQTVVSNGVFSFPSTGVSIALNGVSGVGTCAVERYDSSAVNLVFAGASPTNISRYRFLIKRVGFSFTSAELRFNRNQIPNSGITNAQTVNVFRRAVPGVGTFSPLTNTFNPSFPDEVRATTTSFSEFILGSDDNSNQLPVELTSFTGRRTEQGVELAWRTASELNNAGFEVERKSQGATWNTLGFVRGNGTTTEAQSYAFLDRTASGKVQYRLKQIDFDGQFEYSNIIEVDAGLPKQFALEQNYPNPFNPTTIINYQLPMASNVSLKIYDVLGKEVATLVNARQEAGTYNVNFNGSNLTSGVYFYRLQAGNFVQTRKMMLVK
ncbi:MAG: T9SS type A sorting domain-containing protein [Chloroherpetonaceae bacterium]